ncbi:esterase [Christiangramia fulva]|uniref:Esterase n=1 Tax=Christiangramia fulva TaxID=2126553 RepID=A0A2R3Z2S8_9FLAO|nr:alpha/beta hydrolase-fold protein [Christiangramia fulva]AVR44564.1 esterase [Christiangramia fulva]
MRFKILFLFLIVGFTAFGQKDIVIGKTITFHSKIQNEDRLLDIHLPKNYENSQKTYPVMYLLDSYYKFDKAVGTLNSLVLNELIPDMIIIGIRNTRRNRDLTPGTEILDDANKKRLPNAGGADAFTDFLGKELIPYVNKNYRAAPYKIIVGHSLGGLFNVYTFFKDPELFDAYLTISPSLWYENPILKKELGEVLKDHQDIHSKFYMSIANEGGTMLGNTYILTGKFTSYIKEHNDVDLQFRFDPMFEYTHGTVSYPSIYNGLKFIFADLQYEVPRSKEEILAKGGPQKVMEEIESYYSGLSEKYGFELSSENAMTDLGFALMKEPEFLDAAVEAFKYNTEHYPDSFDAYSTLGMAYEKKGEVEKARRNYERALELVKATGDPEWEFYQTDLDNLNAKE